MINGINFILWDLIEFYFLLIVASNVITPDFFIQLMYQILSVFSNSKPPLQRAIPIYFTKYIFLPWYLLTIFLVCIKM